MRKSGWFFTGRYSARQSIHRNRSRFRDKYWTKTQCGYSRGRTFPIDDCPWLPGIIGSLALSLTMQPALREIPQNGTEGISQTISINSLALCVCELLSMPENSVTRVNCVCVCVFGIIRENIGQSIRVAVCPLLSHWSGVWCCRYNKRETASVTHLLVTNFNGQFSTYLLQIGLSLMAFLCLACVFSWPIHWRLI